ncbi:MAG: hypothetical protein EA406_10980 [Rhodospirillales bacterium]|nr:MAG: hypothetical protein EA406_10980 [Rhodospirillales bacterium]
MIAVVGGGFVVKEISIPKVPTWARALSLLVGLVLVAPFFLKLLGVIGSEDGGFRLDEQKAGPPVGLHADAGPAVSRHGLTMTDLIVEAPQHRLRVGDGLTFAFKLRNTDQRPFTFVEIFVGARGPAMENRDFGWSHEGLTLAPDAVIEYKTGMIPDVPGVWTFWACYAVAGETGENEYCPDRWRAFQVFVAE